MKPEEKPAEEAPVAPSNFYGTPSQNPPPLPTRPPAGSSNTRFYMDTTAQGAKESFPEPVLVEEDPDEPMPPLQETTTDAGPFSHYDPHANTWGATNTSDWPNEWTNQDWGSNTLEGPWGMTADKAITIDGRNEQEENKWWDPAQRAASRRPGPGVLPPLVAENIHNSEHTLFSVSVSPPEKLAPTHSPRPSTSASSDGASLTSTSSSSSHAVPPPPPSPEDVRTAVPHPNAYYCRKHNGWVLLAWKSSAVEPPVASSFKKNNPGAIFPNNERRKETTTCLPDDPRAQKRNHTHHFHIYEKAVDALKLTPPFVRSPWEQERHTKLRNRRATLRLDEQDALPAPAAAEEEEDEGDMLDLYVCCQCSFYAMASDVVPGVVPAKYLEELFRDKAAHPAPGKTGETTTMVALETILNIIEKRLWKNEIRVLPVSRPTFQAKLGWNATIKHIFEALDFTLKPDETGSPTLAPPDTDPTHKDGKQKRQKLLRAWVELGAWTVDFRKRLAPTIKDHPATFKLWIKIDSAREMYQTAIGAHPDQIPRGDKPELAQRTDLVDAWKTLGMTSTTYSWELLGFAYYAQCRCDPEHTVAYFSAFFRIFNALAETNEAPNELQNIVIEERGRDRFTFDNLETGTHVLGFGKEGHLGVEFGDDVEESFIENAWRDVVRRAWKEGSGGTQLLTDGNEAFCRIAEVRNSVDLRNKWEHAQTVFMTPEQAFSTLGVEDSTTIDDTLLIALYQMRVEEAPLRADKMKEAMSVISEYRDSERLRQFMGTGSDPGDIVPPTRQDWPRGLNQLGNTCYLNSLLQYFYTIKELREAVAPLLNSDRKSLEDDKLTDDDLKRHRVGGRLVTRREIVRSKRFVSQLADLFWEMQYNERASITPTIELAKLALVTSKDEEEDDVDRGGTDSSNDTDATLVDDAPPRIMVESPVRSPSEGSMSSILGKRPRDHSGESNMEVDHRPTEADKENRATTSTAAAGPSGSQAQPLQPSKDSSGEKGMDVDPPRDPESSNQASRKPPPLPTRKATESSMMFGRQHDVSECMDNCIFQIETALLKFSGLSDTEEGKASLVKRLFFGTLKQRLTVAQPEEPARGSSVHEREDLFLLLPVNVSDEGFDLYDGLSGYFDDVVEFESKKARMEVTLVDLPPILQIQLQRAQFDRETLQPYKSQAYVKFDETIYVDRFMDGADPVKKERSKTIQSDLNECRDRIHLLTTGKHAPYGPALTNVHEFLKNQDAVVLPELNDDLVLQLGAEPDLLAKELETLRARARTLKQELEAIWEGEHEATYELTSVFIHRGSSPSWGHYFFYSRHLPENPDSWFKYNDSEVSEVPKTEVLADTTGSTANPYMLVYVRKGTDMISAVNRLDMTGSTVYPSGKLTITGEEMAGVTSRV
ncbi:hypothetical protein OF83DRAFT_1169745 [Amylostereum chailletii]|nr:hypothetical protein OF83DRAFT_1169745 [Amylostereum chailletii]